MGHRNYGSAAFALSPVRSNSPRLLVLRSSALRTKEDALQIFLPIRVIREIRGFNIVVLSITSTTTRGLYQHPVPWLSVSDAISASAPIPETRLRSGPASRAGGE